MAVFCGAGRSGDGTNRAGSTGGIRPTRTGFAAGRTARIQGGVAVWLDRTVAGNGASTVSATVENIQRSFEGDGDLQGVDAILRNLEQKHCFTIVNGRCERFRDRSDTKEIEEKKAVLDGKFGDTRAERHRRRNWPNS